MLARFESGAEEMDRAPVSMVELIEEVVTDADFEASGTQLYRSSRIEWKLYCISIKRASEERDRECGAKCSPPHGGKHGSSGHTEMQRH